MWKWIAIVLFGIGSLASGYMALFADDHGERGQFLFSAFGTLFGILCAVFILTLRTGNRTRFAGDRKLSFGRSKTAVVLRWLVLTALIGAVAAFLVLTFFPGLV